MIRLIPLLDVHGFPSVLSKAESWLLHGGMMGYLIATALALIGIFRPRAFLQRLTHTSGGVGLLAFLVYFVLRATEAGAAPLTNVFEVLLMIAAGLIAGYFIVMFFRPAPALAAWVFGAALLIVALALPLAGTLGPAAIDPARWRELGRPLLIAHVVLAVIASAQFVFAFIASIVYLLQDRALRRKADSPVLRSLPSLERLEAIVFRTVATALPVLTLSLVFGAAVVWNAIGDWLLDPVVLASLAMWLVFLAAVIGRLAHLLHGRREMYLVLTGFALVVAVYLGSSVMPHGVHTPERVETRNSERGMPPNPELGTRNTEPQTQPTSRLFLSFCASRSAFRVSSSLSTPHASI